MKKKRTKKEIAFNEEGMRSFNSINEAIDYYFHEVGATNDVRKIVKLFASSHEVKFGRGSFNVSRLKTLSGSQRKTEIKKMINSSSDHAIEAFEKSFNEWINRFHHEVVDRVVEQIIEPIKEYDQPNEDVVNEEVID
jgi:hypothetical protein